MEKEKICTVWTKEGIYNLTLQEWYGFDHTRPHRIDGPAVEWADGSKMWWVNGKQHRIDGPAVVWNTGGRFWIVNDNTLPKKEVETWIKENGVDLKISEDQMAFYLRWV